MSVRGSILSTALGVCLSAFGCGGGDTTIEGDRMLGRKVLDVVSIIA